jgi:hypothetical protein
MDYSLSEQDLIDKLEEIALDDRNRASQIAAIRQLREIRGGVEEQPAPQGFHALYEVGKPTPLRTKKPRAS